MLNICARSLVPEYWFLFVQNSRTMPPVPMDRNGLITAEMVEALAPRLTLLDFFTFEYYLHWHILTPFFHQLELPVSVQVDFSDFVRQREFAAMLPSELHGVLSWPLPHLALVSDNFLAFKAILTHPNFQSEVLDQTVMEYSLEELFEICDEIEIQIDQCPIGFSRSFRSILEEVLRK